MKETGDWRYVYASVPGVAHRASGGRVPGRLRGPVASDFRRDVGAGAGRRRRGGQRRRGARRRGTGLPDPAGRMRGLAGATAATPTGRGRSAETLIERVRTALSQRAAATGLPVREFACTLLGAVLADDRALFLQIGDGAIVIGTGDDYRPVFWPQAGEYANETYFATDAGAAARLEFATSVEPVAEIALLTDGLQPLALHYQTRQAHAPFFRPLFQRLRAASAPGCPADLQTALERFLDAPALNQRTHDDKTLILATRLPAPTAAAVIVPPPAEPAESADPTPADAPAPSGPLPPAIREESGDEAV